MNCNFQTVNEPITKVWMSYNYPHLAPPLPQVIQGFPHILYILSQFWFIHVCVCVSAHVCVFVHRVLNLGISHRQVFSNRDTPQLSPYHENNHIWNYKLQLNDFFHRRLVHFNVGHLSVLCYPISYAHTHIYTTIRNICAPHLLPFFSLQFPSFPSPL